MFRKIARLVTNVIKATYTLILGIVVWIIFDVVFMLPLFAFILQLAWTPAIAWRAFWRLGNYGTPFMETWNDEYKETKKAYRDVAEGLDLIFREIPRNVVYGICHP